MDSKKSLGHFPFGYSTQGESDYSFIPDLNGADSVEVDALETGSDEREHSRHTPAENRRSSGSGDSEYIQVGNVKVKKSLHTTLFEEEKRDEPAGSIFERQVLSSSPDSVPQKEDDRVTKPVSEEPGSENADHRKKVVSYYLEAELINRVKAFADRKNESYSAVAAEALKAYIEKN